MKSNQMVIYGAVLCLALSNLQPARIELMTGR